MKNDDNFLIKYIWKNFSMNSMKSKSYLLTTLFNTN